jgi:SH3 domain protein
MARNTKLLLIVLLVPWLCLMVQPAWATRAYVTDSFEITLRTGPSNENKVIAIISTGQTVEILETREGWSYVRLLNGEEDNKEGWVLSRFLIDRPPWKIQVRAIKEENTRFREKLASHKEKLEEVLRREKDASMRVKAMQKNIQRLTEENRRLKSSQQHKWFAIGALVLLFGLIIGLVIGRKQRSRRFY